MLRFFQLIVRSFFRNISVQGREHLPPRGPLIFASNHPNALIDPVLLMACLREYRIRFVAKAPLFRIPVLAWILRWIGAIPVVRRMEAEGGVDYSAFFAACVDALAAGDSVAIFPEGRSLPLPYLSPLKTGAARLAFLAREHGVDACIVPVGLNYEQGAVFRSAVVVSIGPALFPGQWVQRGKSDPKGEIQGLTNKITRSLEGHLFQAETYRDRELMFLLERLHREEDRDDSWPERLSRLRRLEQGFQGLRTTHSREIEALRELLEQYEQLSPGSDPWAPDRYPPLSGPRKLLALMGLPLAGAGWVLNAVPYQLCSVLVRNAVREDATLAATLKVVYALFLYPLTYCGEALLVLHLFGWTAVAAFSMGIVPLSYFTLFYMEWRRQSSAARVRRRLWSGRRGWKENKEQLTSLRRRMVREVDALAALVDKKPAEGS
jgi:1-acyl-sn-glycerol-3-phosphate acyltransferase